VLLGIIAGVALGYNASGSTSSTYEARTVVLVQPPSNVTGGTGVADADRYLQSQIGVLRSLDLAESTATALGGTWTREQVAASIRVEDRVGTDIVDVYAAHADPNEAQNLANTYVELYKESLEQRAQQQNKADYEDLDTQLEQLRTNLQFLGQAIADATDEYLQKVLSENDQLSGIPMTTPPAAAQAQVNYDTELLKYQELLRTRSDLDTLARTQVATEIVQRAVLPTQAASSPRTLLMIAGGIAGAILGLLGAVVTARFSRRLIDEQQLSTILGHTVVGTIGRHGALSSPLPELLQRTGYPAIQIIDELCVRAEANARRTGFVTVVVVGTEQAAGATTIATALAGQFARFGASVLLVDADPRRSGVTEGFRAFGDGGIPGLLALGADGSLIDGRRSSDTVRRTKNLVTRTSVAEVAVLGRGDKAGSPSLRRSDADTLIERSLQIAPVVVIDAGAVLDAASTVELCRLADAVVLAVPTKRQKTSQLEVVARQLSMRQGELLAVATDPKSHRDRRSKRNSAAVAQEASAVDLA
jgi:capsular polysaccharide biosynthesis protein/Mrp family chromosome partitioning ATPase